MLLFKINVFFMDLMREKSWANLFVLVGLKLFSQAVQYEPYFVFVATDLPVPSLMHQ